MKQNTLILLASLFLPVLYAEEPAFESELFSKGTLLYRDNFDGELNTEFWEPRTKSWEITEGTLVRTSSIKESSPHPANYIPERNGRQTT